MDAPRSTTHTQAPSPFKSHDRIIRGLMLACFAGLVCGAVIVAWS